MSSILVTLEIGGQTLNCHGTATRGEAAQTSGPPERCHEGSPDELEIERVFLETEVTEDLGISAPPRTVELDITDFLIELGVGEEIEKRCIAKFDWDSLYDACDGDAEEYSPG